VDGSGEIVLSHGELELVLDRQEGLRLVRLGLAGRRPWVDERSASGVVAIDYDGKRLDGGTPGVTVRGVETAELDDGSLHTAIQLDYPPDHLVLELHMIAYAESALIEQWVVVHNNGENSVRIERVDSFLLEIPTAIYELISYTSGWGLEFEEVRQPLTGETLLETRKGRSSNDRHPWFALVRSGGNVLSASVMWSGNWVFRFEPRAEGGFQISGGLHDWEFWKDLPPGGSMESPHVAIVLGQRADLNDVSGDYARVGRRHWYPDNELARSLPVEWNHWWPYFDHAINEEVFRQNVDAAARMGLDVCTLDAGWFGPTDPGTHWYDYRGDWDMVNTARFPSGIRALSDYTHERGMKFGIWCEIEGLGQHAHLAQAHPELVALRGGERLGYVCLGNPAAQEWAYATLDRLITEYDVDWIKLDFNLDPGAGCDRTDHGHGAGDGLYEHYLGYYRTLERIRQRHPHVVLEACASGGLRIDLGLLRQTHMTFLSDPDWPEHDLQLFWGASTMLAPEVCLHWGWCEWAENKNPHQTFDPCDPNLTQTLLDYAIRNGMLGAFGYSQKLPDLPQRVADRLAYHASVYKDLVRRFVRHADLYRLTAQPKREGLGDRWAAFQYALVDGENGEEHLLFVFRLNGGEPERTLRLQGLTPNRLYKLSWQDQHMDEQRSGVALMEEGIRFHELPEEGSEIIHITVERG
jgi:alpha-galactosidase